MYNSLEDFNAVRNQLHARLQHPFLMRYIDTPVVDEEKLLLLYSILKSANLHIEHIQHYALTIMLVQIALDTHEKVSDKLDAEAGESHKRRQLTVLAGDYYSGLYYYLLAENHDISLIRALAQGIKEINEQKIRLYQQSDRSVAAVVRSVEIIESSLLQKTCEFFNVPDWNAFSSVVLARKRIAGEYKQYEQHGHAPIFAAWKRILASATEENVHLLYKTYMQETMQQLQNWTVQYAQWTQALKLLEK
nr:heptaprenyl diphosphate synthase component 1 [Ectobacillus panaciterrae]